MKTKIHAFDLIPFLLIGGLLAVAQLEAQSPTDLANMKRLVGNWRTDSRQGCHFAFSLKANNIVVTLVIDRDDLDVNVLKGDKKSFGRFRLGGRRLNGAVNMGAGRGTVLLTGIVSEDFRQIHWRFPSPGVTIAGTGAQAYSDETLLRE